MNHSKLLLAATLLAVSLATSASEAIADDEKPHPMFAQLEVGQRVEARLDKDTWSIRSWGSTHSIAEIGTDYLAVSKGNDWIYIHVSRIKELVIRQTRR